MEHAENARAAVGGKSAVKADTTDGMRPELGLNNVEGFSPRGEDNARNGILATVGS